VGVPAARRVGGLEQLNSASPIAAVSLIPEYYDLVRLPLKIRGGDGAPAALLKRRG